MNVKILIVVFSKESYKVFLHEMQGTLNTRTFQYIVIS